MSLVNAIIDEFAVHGDQAVFRMGIEIMTLRTLQAEQQITNKLINLYRMKGCTLVPVSDEFLSQTWLEDPVYVKLVDNRDGTHEIMITRDTAILKPEHRVKAAFGELNRAVNASGIP